jgi:hypothetical protein
MNSLYRLPLTGGLPATRCLPQRWVATDVAVAVVVLAALGGSVHVSAQTVNVQALASTTLKKDNPNQSFGGQKTLVVRQGGSRVLARFDSAAIRAAVGGGSLASAELQLYIGTNGANWGPTGRTLDVYRVDAAWTESAATWNCPNDLNLANGAPDCAAQWNGGTTEDDASDTVVVTNASSGWISFDVTADVQAFLAGMENDGWLIRKTDESQPGRVDFVSRRGATAQAPRLVLLSESATVDTVPPSLAIVSPGQPVLVNVPSPPIAVAYHDGGSGVDLSTLRVLLDGQDLTASCSVGAQAASCTPPALAAGSHTIAASLRDHAANAAAATAGFELLLGPSINTLSFPVAADTYVNGRAADREHGRAAFLRVAKSGPSRALVALDPAALAAALSGSQLLSAQLALSIAANGKNWGASGRTVGAYRLTQAWSETAATWDCPADSNLGNDQPDCGAPWNGGAFVPSPTATALVTRHLAGTVTFDVTADVAAFLTGTTNAGWLVAKTDELASGRVDFVSREASSGQPAQLVVVVRVPPADTTPPALAITSPSQPVISDPQPPIAVAYSDSGSGVDTSTLAITLDGATLGGCTVGPSAATCPSPTLAAGAHRLAAALRDRAGNAASASLAFEVSALPLIAITSPADGAFFRSSSIPVTGTLGGPVASVSVNGQAATLGPGSFTANLTLAPGANPLVAVATDAAGNQASATIAVTLDTQPPALKLTTPAPGSVTNQPEVTVAGTVTDDFGVASLAVAGAPVAIDGGSFTVAVPVAEGANTIEVDAIDLAGNAQTATVRVTRFSVPAIVITSPPDLSFVTGTTLAVSGTATGAVSVNVNGVAAAVAGTSFTATGVPLVEGGNTVTATATDGAGRVGIATINVVRDLTPPHVAIYTPAGGSTVADVTVTVAGLVNDIVAGTVNAGEVRVSVNGLPATVANRSFVVMGVPLAPGENVLTALAVDASGNQGQASVTVRQAAPAAARAAIVSGSGQTAAIRAPLPQPLVAALLDGTGHPVPGKPVLFRVRDGDGTLDGGRRDIAVTSDANGQAAVHVVLGSRAGAGNQVVEASSPGFGAPAVFLASALPGAPALIVVDSGDQQLGVAGQALPRPLVAAVIDAGGNRLPAVAATLHVVKGAGHFANGQPTLGLTTDSDGRLIASLTTDPAEGVANNVAEATIDALPGGPVASFVASTWAAGDPAQTAVSGVVLDNTNLPVAGVTLRLRDTALTAVTDDQGLFTIAPAPVGTLKLIVDGSTAQRPGAWPDLEFDLTTVPGRTNTLRMPIYLLPLDLGSGIQVDETHGGTLRLAQLPGFALDIQPGSVTFPGGGRSGLVSVTVVHSDKVPMVPNFGQQPRLIVTIQPAGARFDPPARLTLPNVEGLAPGQVTEFYSFDHDLGHFVSIGPGTVSDDGAVVTSNAGVGIVKSGWHCCGFPQGTGTPNSCPGCTACTGDQCVPQMCKACSAPGKYCDTDTHCVFGFQLIPSLCDGLKVEEKGLVQGTCSGVPILKGIPDLCGAAAAIDYPDVVITKPLGCASVDLTGGVWSERVSSDDGCHQTGGIAYDTCAITSPGNRLAPQGKVCRDYLYSCDFVSVMRTCVETRLQKIYIGSCHIATKRIVFNITADGTRCSGQVTRADVPPGDPDYDK